MTEENKPSNTSTIIINITCLIIGGLVVYYLLKPKISVASFNPTNISSLENRLIKLEQLSLNKTEQSIQTTPSQQTTYNNSEKTNFILNKDGDIVGMETIRNAKIG